MSKQKMRMANQKKVNIYGIREFSAGIRAGGNALGHCQKNERGMQALAGSRWASDGDAGNRSVECVLEHFSEYLSFFFETPPNTFLYISSRFCRSTCCFFGMGTLLR